MQQKECQLPPTDQVEQARRKTEMSPSLAQQSGAVMTPSDTKQGGIANKKAVKNLSTLATKVKGPYDIVEFISSQAW